jgi:heme-degrading monooxygenase HmoA
VYNPAPDGYSRTPLGRAPNAVLRRLVPGAGDSPPAAANPRSLDFPTRDKLSGRDQHLTIAQRPRITARSQFALKEFPRMFTRTFDFTLKPELKEKFFETIETEILPKVKTQAGFVDLMCLISDDYPEHAMLLTFWKSKSEAEQFYRIAAPIVDSLLQYTKKNTVEHFLVQSSSAFKVAYGNAA